MTTLLRQSNDVWGDGNHPQGCAFSPDGLCVLTTTVQDAKLRLYNTLHVHVHSEETSEEEKIAEWKAALVCQSGETVRSYDWYPHMKSNDPSSCCFLATSRDQPIHLFDAYMGTVRASYRPYNALDEMESPTVAIFSRLGDRIWASGFRTDRTIHIFDTARPGRDSSTLHLGKTRRSSDGQKGLVSSLASSPDSRVFAVGTYSPGSIYVYDDRTGQSPTGTILNGVCVVGHGRSHSKRKRRFVIMTEEEEEEGQSCGDSDWLSVAKIKWFLTRAQGGITQLQFAPEQQYTLYSASRRSDGILAWDLRMLSDNPENQSHPIRGFESYGTKNDTNQRLEFDLDEHGKTIFVGGRDECVRIYDVRSGDLLDSISNLGDAANGVSFKEVAHQTRRLAVATGSRHFRTTDSEDEEPNGRPRTVDAPGFLRLYNLR